MYLMANDHIGVVKSHAIRIRSKEVPLCWCYCQKCSVGRMDEEILHESTVTAFDSTRKKKEKKLLQ